MLIALQILEEQHLHMALGEHGRRHCMAQRASVPGSGIHSGRYRLLIQGLKWISFAVRKEIPALHFRLLAFPSSQPARRASTLRATASYEGTKHS